MDEITTSDNNNNNDQPVTVEQEQEENIITSLTETSLAESIDNNEIIASTENINVKDDAQEDIINLGEANDDDDDQKEEENITQIGSGEFPLSRNPTEEEVDKSTAIGSIESEKFPLSKLFDSSNSIFPKALSTKASAPGSLYFSIIFLSSEPALTPILIEISFAFAAAITSLILSGPILPGLTLKHAAPESAASKALL